MERARYVSLSYDKLFYSLHCTVCSAPGLRSDPHPLIAMDYSASEPIKTSETVKSQNDLCTIFQAGACSLLTIASTEILVPVDFFQKHFLFSSH